MRILLINTYDLRGGAARATWRLFEGLKETRHQVNLLVQEKRSADPDVILAASPGSRLLNTFRPYLDFAIPLIHTRQRVLFSTAMIPDKIVEQIDRLNPDVVHLNWVTGGFIRIESLAQINRPLIWTFHDLWPFTGGCHNPLTCTSYKQTCGRCPILHSTRENDLSKRVFQRKQSVYSEIRDMTITTPSRWLAQRVKESTLLGNRIVVVIPNGLDTSVFRSSGREGARKRLNLPTGKKIILFGAIRATETPLKGFGLLVQALKILNRTDHQLVVFGSSSAGKTGISGLDVRFFGLVNNLETLIDLYSAADVVAVPSYQEVFGQAASEALACGTPVVAFGATGLLDIVAHKHTGYLARPFDTGDLAEGIRWLIEDPVRYGRISENAAKQAREKFDIRETSIRYISLYREVIKRFNNSTDKV